MSDDKTAEASEVPPSPPVAAVQTAYEAGDYARVHALLAALGEPDGAADTERVARLRARVEVDPVQIGVLAACLAILIAVVFSYAH